MNRTDNATASDRANGGKAAIEDIPVILDKMLGIPSKRCSRTRRTTWDPRAADVTSLEVDH